MPLSLGFSYGEYSRKMKSWPLLLLPMSHPASANSPQN